MHRSLKPHAQAKKVPPPAIPGDPQPVQHQHHHHHHHHHQEQYHQQIPLYRLGGSISSGVGRQLDDAIIMSSMVSSPSLEEGGFNLPRETSVALRIKDEITDYGTGMSSSASTGGGSNTACPKQTAGGVGTSSISSGGVPGSGSGGHVNPLVVGCPPSIVPCPPPVFCATLREPLTHKAAVYYHQQLALQEDQGIDLTQSPGRDSPGSSSGSAGSGSRHSTASLDSGRASSYLTGVSGASIRGSTGGSSSSGGGGCGGALSSPRCSSVSSCSIGSVDRMSQRNDELIIDWLLEMKYEEYAQLFIGAGYDLPTIARMTPEDLTAIGIKNPHHRERIKQRIDKLQVLDNLPHFVPGSIEEWLQLLRLEEYIQPLLDQNYKTVRDVTQVTWEDLEDIGIVKLGHQKKILLAIKRVKDIISGKWNPGGPNAYQQQEYRRTWQNSIQIPTTPTYLPTTRVSWDDSKSYASSNNADAAYYCTGSNHECCNGNDVVLIKVRQPRGKSLESLEDIHDNSTRSHLTFSHYTTTDYGHFGHTSAQLQQQQHQQLHQQQILQQQQHQQQQQLQQQQQGGHMMGNRIINNASSNMTWRRSYDDGDITPTNDAQRDLMYDEGGGTLPRQQRNILQRAVLNSMPPLEHHHYMNAAAAAAEYVCQTGGVGGVGAGDALASGIPGVADSASLNAAYLAGSPMANKKIAPEPPRRHCSIRNSRTLATDAAQMQQHQIQQNLQQHQQQQQTYNVALHGGGGQNIYYGGTTMLGGSPVAGGIHGMHHSGASGASQYIPIASMQQQQQHQQIQQQPIYANYATIQQTTAEIHCEKFNDNKSNSSIDSIDTIPFANENTGTIKQRLLNRQDLMPLSSSAACNNQQQQQQLASSHLLSSSSSSSSSSTNTIAAANHAHSFHSLKSSSSLHDASLIRSDSLGSTTSVGSCGSSGVLLRSPTLQYPTQATPAAASTASAANATMMTAAGVEANPCSSLAGVGGGGGGSAAGAIITTTVDLHTPGSGCGDDGGDDASLSCGGASSTNHSASLSAAAAAISGSGKTVSVNVLNDIGNMLANLTDELDAMLEEEKRAGLNIDSE